MNESYVEVDVHSLRDGNLHVCLDGKSHVVFAKEEVLTLTLTS